MTGPVFPADSGPGDPDGSTVWARTAPGIESPAVTVVGDVATTRDVVCDWMIEGGDE